MNDRQIDVDGSAPAFERLVNGLENIPSATLQVDVKLAREELAAKNTEIDRLKADNQLAWSDCHDGTCHACSRCCDAALATVVVLGANINSAMALIGKGCGLTIIDAVTTVLTMNERNLDDLRQARAKVTDYDARLTTASATIQSQTQRHRVEVETLRAQVATVTAERDRALGMLSIKEHNLAATVKHFEERELFWADEVATLRARPAPTAALVGAVRDLFAWLDDRRCGCVCGAVRVDAHPVTCPVPALLAALDACPTPAPAATNGETDG